MKSLCSGTGIPEGILTVRPVLHWSFGAMMGQREGQQGQSYAIPTIGGTIDKKELQESVARFTEYATEHPELTFLVTPVGCGGGGWRPWMVAPMFRNASKLENVYLPLEFWDEL